jgi:hypothetical protein
MYVVYFIYVDYGVVTGFLDAYQLWFFFFVICTSIVISSWERGVLVEVIAGCIGWCSL